MNKPKKSAKKSSALWVTAGDVVLRYGPLPRIWSSVVSRSIRPIIMAQDHQLKKILPLHFKGTVSLKSKHN
jgi:hypothetical protein